MHLRLSLRTTHPQILLSSVYTPPACGLPPIIWFGTTTFYFVWVYASAILCLGLCTLNLLFFVYTPSACGFTTRYSTLDHHPLPYSGLRTRNLLFGSIYSQFGCFVTYPQLVRVLPLVILVGITNRYLFGWCACYLYFWAYTPIISYPGLRTHYHLFGSTHPLSFLFWVYTLNLLFGIYTHSVHAPVFLFGFMQLLCSIWVYALVYIFCLGFTHPTSFIWAYVPSIYC